MIRKFEQRIYIEGRGSFTVTLSEEGGLSFTEVEAHPYPVEYDAGGSLFTSNGQSINWKWHAKTVLPYGEYTKPNQGLTEAEPDPEPAEK